MKSEEYEKARKELYRGEEANRFLPFYRNHLKPILQQAVIDNIKAATNDQERLAASIFARFIDEEMEKILHRIISRKESAELVLREAIKNVGR